MKPFLSFSPALLVGALVVLTPLLAAVASPSDEDQAAVVFPPGWSRADVMRAAARADVDLVRFGALDNVAVFQVAGRSERRRIRDAGGWLILPPGALGGCFLPRTTASLSSRLLPSPGDTA